MDKLISLNKVFKKYLELNKKIIDEYAIAVVPTKRLNNFPVNDLDIEEDFIFFCFTKFTKSLIAIQHLLLNELNEDALILTRSNFECLINAKSIVKNSEMINHLVEYKLGLINEKKYKKKPRSQIANVGDQETFEYISSVWKIAEIANEETTYKFVYSFLCEVTHLNMLTSGYYREGTSYSYTLTSGIAKHNALLWNVYFNLKFYQVLIESEIIEDEKCNKLISTMLITGTILLKEVFEIEITRIRKDSNNTEEQLKYIDILEQLIKNIENFS